MKGIFFVWLLAVCSVQAMPNLEGETELKKDVKKNERSERDVAVKPNNNEKEKEEKEKEDKRDEPSRKLDVDVDVNINDPGQHFNDVDVDVDVNIGADSDKEECEGKAEESPMTVTVGLPTTTHAPETTVTPTTSRTLTTVMRLTTVSTETSSSLALERTTIDSNPITSENHNRLMCENCGQAKVSIPRIVGGSEATQHEYPWLAFLHMRTALDTFNCGGSFITRQYVLTAAHCVSGDEIEEVYVFAGSHRYPDTEKLTSGIKASDIIVHEDYDSVEKHHDIALVKLGRRVSFGRTVSAACLANDDDMRDEAVVAGWGQLVDSDPDALPDTLMEVALNISNQDDCKDIFEGTVDVTENMMCTYSIGKDACVGDSGGPLSVEVGTEQWVQVGIVSFGAGCARTIPGVYTRVSKYHNWIQSHVGQPMC